MLDNPTDKTLQAIATYCSSYRIHKPLLQKLNHSNNNHNNNNTTTARSSSNDHMVLASEVSFIIESIHTLRKSMPMQKHIAFLLDSTGLMSFVNDTTIV
jgi:hypothetical protein